MSQIITLTETQIKEHPFITKNGDAGFYNLIRTLCNTDDKTIDTMDCTKINVAQNIQKSWYTYATEHGINTADLSMHLLLCGPKTLEHLTDNTVELLDGCFTYK